MAVLSWSREEYIKYAANIRKEYSHVEHDEYCRKRGQFLRHTIQSSSSSSSSKIYHSQYYANNEQIAKDNMEYECNLLEQLKLIDDHHHH